MQLYPLKPDLLTAQVGTELVVLNGESSQAICLNQVSSVIWRLCDGRSDVAAIAAQATAELDATWPMAAGCRQTRSERVCGCRHLTRPPVSGAWAEFIAQESSWGHRFCHSSRSVATSYVVPPVTS